MSRGAYWRKRNVQILEKFFKQKCPKSQNFLHLMWFLASGKKKGFENKRLMHIYPKFSYGVCHGKHKPFFLALSVFSYFLDCMGSKLLTVTLNALLPSPAKS